MPTERFSKKVGKTVWVECFDLLVHGMDEEGNEVGESVGPFHTREKAEAWADAAYPGFTRTIMTTMEPKGTRFVGAYRPKKSQ